MSSSAEPNAPMRRAFCSLRFGRDGPKKEAKELKKALAKHGIDLFVAAPRAGQDITNVVFSAIKKSELFIALATKTYGENTGNPACTLEELNYWRNKMEPKFPERLIPINMLKPGEQHEHIHAELLFTNNAAYETWTLGEPMPTELPGKILEASMAPVRRIKPQAAAVAKSKPAAEAPAPKAPSKPATPRKRKTPPAAEKGDAAPKKKRLTGLKSAMDASAPLGVVDPESKIEGTIASHDGAPCDAMLALVDPSKHSDKYFVLQLIRRNASQGGGTYAVYSRWGRNGTSGQALVQDFDDEGAAAACFEDKFKEKTGLKWEDRAEPAKSNKYRFVAQNFWQKQAGFLGALWQLRQYWVDLWQYWVDDGT